MSERMNEMTYDPTRKETERDDALEAAHSVRGTGLFRAGGVLCLGAREIHPLAPRPGEIKIRDIARTMSHVCRWGGKGSRFYSVAEHSLRVEALVRARHGDGDPVLLLHALLHDAHEGVTGVDLPRPIKNRAFIRTEGDEALAWRDLEAAIDLAVWSAVGIPAPNTAARLAIIEADNCALAIEAADIGIDPSGEWIPMPDGFLDDDAAMEAYRHAHPSRASHRLTRTLLVDRLRALGAQAGCLDADAWEAE